MDIFLIWRFILWRIILEKIKEDILKERLDFREDTKIAYLTEKDKKHYIQFDEISEHILKNVPK